MRSRDHTCRCGAESVITSYRTGYNVVKCTSALCGRSFRVYPQKARVEKWQRTTDSGSGNTPRGWYRPAFKELHRDPFAHMKLALAIRR